MTNYAPSFTVAKLYEKTSQQDEGSRLRQKLVHLQYRAKLQEHITLAVTRIREDSAAANAKPEEIGAERPRKALELEGARPAVEPGGNVPGLASQTPRSLQSKCLGRDEKIMKD